MNIIIFFNVFSIHKAFIVYHYVCVGYSNTDACIVSFLSNVIIFYMPQSDILL